jgi:SAM-dependent methyltransferase
LPIYRWADKIDNVNFSAETAWEHRLQDGGSYCFQRKKQPGRQWIREAANLHGLADEAYECVLSSHCLEHTANPLGALREWRRVARTDAALVLVLPDPEVSFDHRRPITTLAHLLEDFRLGTSEADLSHVAEILDLHDLALDPDAGSPDEFRRRSLANADHRCLHHHVFDPSLLAAALGETGWSVLAVEKVRPIHLVALARKGVR